MAPTWWRRNRLWLALLLPALALALAASAFRLVTLYLPWEWSRATWAHNTTGTLRQDYLGTDDVRRTRVVTVTVDSLRQASTYAGSQAAPGGTLWVLDLSFEADPDQILDLCRVVLVDSDGVRYSAGHEGQVSDGTDLAWEYTRFDCVPEDTPGPTLFLDTLEEPEVPGPRRGRSPPPSPCRPASHRRRSRSPGCSRTTSSSTFPSRWVSHRGGQRT